MITGQITLIYLVLLAGTTALALGIPTDALGQSVIGQESFERQIVDDAMPGGYAVELADINGDGLPDIVALATNPPALAWYRNPDWQRFAIEAGTSANISVAAQDIDSDGDQDLVLASEFSLQRSSDGGDIHWLENPGDANTIFNWHRHYIDSIPTAHRLRWGDLNGDGRADLLTLPIVGVGSSPPEYGVGVEFRAYQIPTNPRRNGWPHVVLDRSLQMAHGMSLVNWDNDHRMDILTASFTGVDLFQLAVRGRSVYRARIGTGHTGQRPAIGASEVALGLLGISRRFIATIEPWHGNEVVVYVAGVDAEALWNRQVIGDHYPGGHALLAADLNNDNTDEIISGHRSTPYNVSIYQYRERDDSWRRTDLDAGSVSASGLAAGDLNGDGFVDLVAIGGATGNVVLYLHRGY